MPHYWWRRLVQKRQVEIFDVHEFELGVGTLLCDFVNPFGHGLAISIRSCASENDCDLYHNVFPELVVRPVVYLRDQLAARFAFAKYRVCRVAMLFRHDGSGVINFS